MTRGRLSLLAIIVVLRCSVEQANGHGRLLNPPSRSSMWRMGFKTPKNYNDNELFCGGLTRQRNNGMRCGICGDPYDVRTPRANEMGGRYYSGIISERYDQEQVIKATVELTANHNGFFEFHVCRVNGNASLETEECLQQNPLEVVGEGRSAHGSPYRYYVPRPVTGKYVASLKLPKHFSCDHCVFQWTYTAGNNWGQCEDGHQAVGCGPQETFRGCADIAIGTSSTNQIPVIAPITPVAQDPVRRPTVQASRPPLFIPASTESWNHWQSNNAWPQSVNPGYPAESNRTTWFYHQWPSTPDRVYTVHKVDRLPAPTETFDLKVPRPTPPRGHHWFSPHQDTRKSITTARPSAFGHHYGDDHGHTHDLKTPQQFERWPTYQKTIRNFATIHHEMEDLPDDPVRGIHETQETSTTSRPTLQPSYIHRTLPPVVSIDNVQNEVLTDTIVTKRPALTSEKGSCVAAGLYKNVPGMTDWCNQNCFFTPPFCPESHCACS